MNIRPATAVDVPAVLPMVERICALHQQWDPRKYGFRENPGKMYKRWLTARTTDPRAVFLVADRTDKMLQDVPFLAGFLIGTVEREIPIYRLAEYGFIHDLWVEPTYRNEGIGRQMVMLAIERFREIGVEQIRLDTAAQNEVARGLFASCGFRPSVQEMLLEIGNGAAERNNSQ
ncbi:MAG TPA: GNAT family N-acetyltransferase [Tepidisphaeraceae bacterium]|nr:GNAT family N-acetyltransferase [Tepidisphaeraceae bacterium]